MHVYLFQNSCDNCLLPALKAKRTSKTKFRIRIRHNHIHMPDTGGGVGFDVAPSPEGLQRPLRLRSPEVASTTRFEDKDRRRSDAKNWEARARSRL